MKDPVVEEIRKIRHEIEAENHNNADELVRTIMEKQKRHSKVLISRKPKLIRRKKVA
jgi:hypothetical protein